MMSGAWPPPAPSVWYMWTVRPAMAASVSSTKPLSFSVSVWSCTWKSSSSATLRQVSMAAGMAPQSSWILRPRQPVSSCSTSEAGLWELPRPRKPKLIGQASAACSILPVLNGPPLSMPTVMGPSEPPSMVVMPLAMACSHNAAESKWT